MKTNVIVASVVAGFLMVACNPQKVSTKEQFALNEAVSVAEWKGATSNTENTGSFAVKSEGLEAEDGRIKKGKFIIPIASIKNFNLPDPVKPQLLDHLKSPDFFNMVLYPEATFTVTSVVPYTGQEAGAIAGANYRVSGDFTMLGKTNPVSFPAKILITGDKLTTEATFKIDRTKWGMTYATDPALKEHYIFPDVAIHLKLEGKHTGTPSDKN
jgi:polyisoprenoid-binding protein YceI